MNAFCQLSLVASVFLSYSEAKVRIVVSTENGQIAGEVNGTQYGTTCLFFPATRFLPNPGRPNVASFLGIPYASPPIGELRFRPPVNHPKWDGVREAKAVGPVCAQLPLVSYKKIPEAVWPAATEDCLFLNVWSPARPDGSLAGRKPIILFVHGGAFMAGSGYQMMGCPFYNAQGLAGDTDSVLVTINYRLGVFGYLADPALKNESGTTGNYGLQDQRAAIAWIQRNALSLGGDPLRITIMGESAGAASALHHAVLPRSKGLFAQVISESGYDLTWSLKNAYATGDKLVSDVGCSANTSRVQCLRNLPTKKLLEAQADIFFSSDFISRALFWGPVSDGFELPENTTFAQAMATAKPNIPLLIGSNLNETNLFLCLDSNVTSLTWQSATDYLLKQVQRIVPGTSVTKDALRQLMLQHYSGYASAPSAVMAFTTDFLFTCAAHRSAKAFSASGSSVYKYLFVRPPKIFKMEKCMGVPHVAETLLLFKDAFPSKAAGIVVGDVTERKLAKFMIGGWGAFAHGSPPDVTWPQWHVSEPTLEIGSSASGDIAVVSRYRSDACAGIDKIMCRDCHGSVVDREDYLLI